MKEATRKNAALYISGVCVGISLTAAYALRSAWLAVEGIGFLGLSIYSYRKARAAAQEPQDARAKAEAWAVRLAQAKTPKEQEMLGEEFAKEPIEVQRIFMYEQGLSKQQIEELDNWSKQGVREAFKSMEEHDWSKVPISKHPPKDDLFEDIGRAQRKQPPRGRQ